MIPISAHVEVDYFVPGVPSQYRVVMHDNASEYAQHIPAPASAYAWPPMTSHELH